MPSNQSHVDFETAYNELFKDYIALKHKLDSSNCESCRFGKDNSAGRIICEKGVTDERGRVSNHPMFSCTFYKPSK